MDIGKRAKGLLSRLLPSLFGNPDLPQIEESEPEVQPDGQEIRRKKMRERLAKVAETSKLPIDDALHEIGGRINDDRDVFRAAAVEVLKKVGLKIVAERQLVNRARQLLVKRWREEKNTHIIRGIQQAVMEINEASQKGQSQN